MPVIDERGRLFGRINIIDAAIAAIIVALVPLAVGAFVLFREPVPRLVSITPAQVMAGRETTVQITGENLRAFLTAFVGPTESKGYLVQSTTLADIRVPELPAGSYDVALFDQGTELSRLKGALTVAPSPVKQASVKVRFTMIPELVSHVKVGTAEHSSASNGDDGAVITEIASDQTPVRGSVLHLRNGRGGLFDSEPGVPFQVDQPMVSLTMTLRVPATSSTAGWTYHNRPLKIGTPFTFESDSGVMDGIVLDVAVQP